MWSGRRGRPRRRREADHQRLSLERETNPFGTRHCQQCAVHTENHHRDPRQRMPKARQTNQKCRRYHSRTQTMKLQNALRWMRRAHQCRTQGGASSSSSTAAPDPCVTTPVRQTRPRSPDPSENVVGKSLVSQLPKKLRSAVGEDDDNMIATIAEITEVCVGSRSPTGNHWLPVRMSAQRGPCAGTVHEWYIWGT